MRRSSTPPDWVPELAAAPGPIYLAVVDALEADIAAGSLPPGRRLPTHRSLAAALRVDLTTITRAYAEARRRGLVDAAVGRGTFVRAVPRRAPAKAEIDLSMNMPPQPPGAAIPTRLAQATAAVLRRTDPAQLLSYHPSGGSLADRRVGAAWLAPLIPGLQAERVLVSGGAQAAVMALLTMLARAGEVVLTEAFTYPGLRAAAAQLGIRLEALPMDAEGLLPDALEEACRRLSPSALYCIPTIQNPTTATMPAARREAVAEVARRHGLRIVEDDAYGMLPTQPLPPLASFAPELTWYVSTLSKCLSPGLRIAYVAAPDELQAERAQAALRATIQMAPPLSAAVATRWIQDGTAQSILQAIRAESRERQKLARAALPAGLAAGHPDGHHLWLRLPPSWSAPAFADHVRRAGLAVVPSGAFAVGATPVEALRISLGAAADRAVLGAALHRIAATLKQDAYAMAAIV
ncbi:aminotransferase-like domain-containing protein [Arenibaculum pallidiluteum]|uniref:aminotransferase-like domain-containing protein n=1 Tax=Arenibaculum pallidiluteum TaxID=2812559 RepID=UPI001A966AEC|nr:PLP-dependent aminotransferase family protein [Arenibaculum pallidiluteum]